MVDFLGLMKQATELKSKMEAMQAELDRIEVEGAAGGGLVTLKLSGKGEVRAAHVDDSLLKPDQKEILQDLIVAAHADARRKLEALLAERMQALTGGTAAAARAEIVLVDARRFRRSRDRTPDPACSPACRGSGRARRGARRSFSSRSARR